MKRRWVLRAGLVLAAFAVSLPGQNEADQENAYDKLMKAAGETVAEIKKSIESDLPAAVSGAEKLSVLFDEVESFWINRDLDEPQLLSQDVMDAADELSEAASEGERNAALSAFTKMTAVCAQCHSTYREELPDGSFRIRR